MSSNLKFGAMNRKPFSSTFFFRQLFDRISCTYTYLLADTETREAILIDPVMDLAERDVKTIKELGLDLTQAVNTHMHADHITGTGLLKKIVPLTKTIISAKSGAKADIYVQGGDSIIFGKHKLEVRETQGHTSGCITLACHEEACAFTGDALLIRGCGRTDFQEGSPQTLYDSVWTHILSLPDHFRLYPAHDYNGQTETSVIEEKEFNPRLSKSKEEFVKIMDTLNLDSPKMIDVALPANKACGLYDLPEEHQKLLDKYQ